MGTTELQRFIDNKSLVALKKFAKAEAELKELKAKHDEVVEKIKEAMIANGVTKIDGDWGYITLAERVSYKAEDIDQVPDEFLKPTLDTTKVKAEATLKGVLPAGVSESRTQYITKKLKEV
ncbi:MAG TPA: hypothetical protein PLJ04_03525 [Candidatus Saccharibacteria bacterium]|nr:hypothetical protein [Candidatus Saccharibacteria bacterium]